MSGNKSVVDPRLLDTLQSFKSGLLKSLNCAKVGQIQRFNRTKRTAEVQIMFKRVLMNDKVERWPVLVDVPVFTLQGGGAAITFPIEAGDDCLVLFSDRNLSTWFATGQEAEPPDGRLHDASDAIALVGLNSLASTAVNYRAGEAAFEREGGRFGIDANGKITVQNDAASLRGILTDLLTVLNGLTVDLMTGIVTPATQAGLAAVQTEVELLLF